MNPPQVYTCSPSWNPSHLPPISSLWVIPVRQPWASCIMYRPGLEIHFTYVIIHVSMPFSQIIPPSPSPTESKNPFHTSVSLLLSRIQGYHYPAILIPTCASFSPSFLMMYSAYKLNKQGDNIQPWRTRFPIWNQSVVPCPVLTVASWPAYRFLKRQVRCS